MTTLREHGMDGAASPQQIRTVMIDRQRAFVQALTRCANATPDLRIVDSASDLAEGENAIRVQQPHLVVVDIEGAMESVLRLRESLAVRIGETKVAVLTGDMSDRLIEHAIHLNASCILKSESLDVILDAFRRIHAGEMYFSPSLRDRLQRDAYSGEPRVRGRKCLQEFTPRQLEVLRAIASGQKVKDVAERLHLSPKSVEAHKYRIMNRLGIHDRVELCLYAVREGLIRP